MSSNSRIGILCFTGNAGNAASWAVSTFGPMFNQGYVHIYEYPSFGTRNATSDPLIAEQIERQFLEEVRIGMNMHANHWIVVGVSMGTGFATRIVREYPELFEAVILIVPYSSIRNVIDHFTSGLLGRFTSYDWLNNEKNLEAITEIPVYAFFGEEDSLLPIGVHMKPLERVLDRFEVVEGAGHNDVMFHASVVSEISSIVEGVEKYYGIPEYEMVSTASLDNIIRLYECYIRWGLIQKNRVIKFS